ncbi:MAG: TIM barrel protein [Gemmatimonadaceae bacterium]
MDRRAFVKSSAMAGGLMALPWAEGWSVTPSFREPVAPKFKLAYAPHFGMFTAHAGTDLVAQLEFMAAEGFTALEDNGMKGRSVADQERIGSALARLDMKMGVFVAHTIDWNEPGIPSGKPEKIDKFLQEVRESVDVAKRVNAKWITVVPGRRDERRDMEFQAASLIDTLRKAAAILEPHGIVMVLEMLNTRINHPGQFFTHTGQGYMIARAVNSPSCKLLYDMYHMQITEGNIIPNMNAAWDEIAYFQVGDNPGRNEPGTGEMNYRNIFRHIHSRGFTGVVGMEHGNSIRGGRGMAEAERAAIDKRGERAVIDAYRVADAF